MKMVKITRIFYGIFIKSNCQINSENKIYIIVQNYILKKFFYNSDRLFFRALINYLVDCLLTYEKI